MATPKPRARKQRIRREQVREAQRRRRERLRDQHQRFLQLLVPEDLHQMLSKIANDLEVSVQQLALDLIRKALGASGNDLERALEPIQASVNKTVVPESPEVELKDSTDHSGELPVNTESEPLTELASNGESKQDHDPESEQTQLSLF